MTVGNSKNSQKKKEETRLGKKINVFLTEPEKRSWGRKSRTLNTISCTKCGLCSLYAKGQCLNVGLSNQDEDASCKLGHIYSATFDHLSASRSHALLKVCEKDSVYNTLKHPDNWYVEFADDQIFLDLKFAICDNKSYSSGELIETKDYHVRIPEALLGWHSTIPISEFTPALLNEIATFGNRLSEAVATEYREKVVPEVLRGIKKILPGTYKAYVETYLECLSI